MIWLNEQLGVAFHIVGDFVPKRPRTMRVGPYTARIVGVEELIMDRLSAAKLLNIPADYEKAKVLYDNLRNRSIWNTCERRQRGRMLKIHFSESPRRPRAKLAK